MAMVVMIDSTRNVDVRLCDYYYYYYYYQDVHET